jgi:hypothetical protein
MDRRAIARDERRRQALEALEFERARADALRERLQVIVAELDGPAVDEPVFARMDPADVEVVRPVLQPPEPDAVDEEEPPAAEEPETEDYREEEIARLAEEIAVSRRHQVAFERYLEALGSA